MQKINYKKLLLKKNKEPISCLTAYSKPLANILDGNVDLILVGDSLGTTLYGMKNTRSVNLEMMKNHGKAVVTNTKKSMTIIDMPYNTYRNSKEALKNAKLVMRKTKCEAIKLEGGSKIISTVKTLVKNKIPVMGHLGILPQTEKKFTFKGKKTDEINKLLKDSKLLEKAGIFSIVLECVESKLAKKITNQLKIPTIGIGSSVNCDGQVLVTDDLIGLSESKFKFVKKYTNLNQIINSTVKKYRIEVLKKKFPKAKHSFNK